MFSLKLFRMRPIISSGIVRKSLANVPLKVLIIRNHRQITTHQSSLFDREILSSFQAYRFMAGHSKWQNIKHVKAEKDKQKSFLCNKYVRKVYSAVRERGPDPKQNSKLAQILEMAKKENVPSSTLETALKKASSKKFEAGTIELLGPGGCMIVLEYETDNVGDMRRAIKQLCRKYSVGIYPSGGGRWRSAYEQKGTIKVTNQLNGEPFDAEKMLDFAIEAGAEDVQKSEDDANKFYEFFCAPEDLNFVKKELEKTFVIDEAFVAFLPISTAVLSDEDKSIAADFLNELGDQPDVTRLYENIE